MKKELQNQESVIDIRNVQKSFGAKEVLKDVSLKLRKQENLVVLGKSGTGKSVLIKCIVRLLKADAGEIEVFGQEVNALDKIALDDVRKKIGFLFQSAALYDSMTVRENLEFPLRRIRKGLSEEEINQKVEQALENVGLVASLEFLLDRTVENREFHADDSVEDHITFPLNVQLQIYRIAQEVLTNIVRHSDAKSVQMSVEAPDPGEFELTIRDDGKTFQPDGSKTTGRGISNIKSRANLINGKVSWKESRRGGNVFSLKIG